MAIGNVRERRGVRKVGERAWGLFVYSSERYLESYCGTDQYTLERVTIGYAWFSNFATNWLVATSERASK
jgi:hypothetical protein